MTNVMDNLPTADERRQWESKKEGGKKAEYEALLASGKLDDVLVRLDWVVRAHGTSGGSISTSVDLSYEEKNALRFFMRNKGWNLTFRRLGLLEYWFSKDRYSLIVSVLVVD